MKKTYQAPQQQIITISLEGHILNASGDHVNIDSSQTGEAGSSYSIDKSEIWDVEWDEE